MSTIQMLKSRSWPAHRTNISGIEGIWILGHTSLESEKSDVHMFCIQIPSGFEQVNHTKLGVTYGGLKTEAWWLNGRVPASHAADPGSNPGFESAEHGFIAIPRGMGAGGWVGGLCVISDGSITVPVNQQMFLDFGCLVIRPPHYAKKRNLKFHLFLFTQK